MWLLLWACLVLLAAAAYLVANTWLAHDPWALGTLRKLPRSLISHAFGEAEVRLVGTVRGIRPRQAPNGGPCILFHTINEEAQRHGRHGIAETTWVRTSDDLGACDFWLDDGSGAALVVADGELVRPLFVHSRYMVTNELGDRRAFEAIVIDGERICVCGYATWEVMESGASADVAPEIEGRRLVVRAGDRRPIVISDDPALLAD